MIKEKLFSENAEEIQQNEKVVEEIDLKKNDDSPENLSFEDKQINKSKNEIVNEEIEAEIIKEKIKKDPNVIAFKEMGKARDTDSKIISFFTKIFDAEEEEKVKDEKPRLKKIKLKKDFENAEEKTVTLKKLDPEYKTKPLKIESLEEGNNLSNNIKESQEEEIVLDSQSDNTPIENKTFDINNNPEREKEDLAFFRPQLPKKKKIVKEEDRLVGLLLPLTGTKSSAGNIVINSLRYSMLLKPNDLNFKIFDTKGTPQGAIEASKQGIKSGIKTFIGPIFSDETREVKNYFDNKKNLTFFSLSPDLSNVSENVIVSGQNPEDQISCIIQHIGTFESEKMLLIHHSDKYGYVIKESVLKFMDSFGLSGMLSLDFFEIEKDTILNNEIRELSKFELRKNSKNEIESLKIRDDLDINLKKTQNKKTREKTYFRLSLLII